MPYNRALLLRYRAHINVEWCNQTRAIKYLFKYINKGSDRVTAKLSTPGASIRPAESEDEIKAFYNCRYISPCEEAWRIFAFPIHYRSTPVERLNFHLEGEHQVIYNDDDPITDILNRSKSDTSMFLAWMESNKKHAVGMGLYYYQYPSMFVWNSQKKEWTLRSKGFAIGRLYHVTPGSGERYYLRMLLNHVKGPTCYEDIRTVDGVTYPTFKEACYVRGLLDDEREYIDGIVEASSWGSACYLRNLFVVLLMSGSISRHEDVWAKTWNLLSDDILAYQRRILRFHDLQLTDEEIKNLALSELEKLLQSNGCSLKNFPQMPLPDEALLSNRLNRLIQDELQYDVQSLLAEHSTLISSFTEEQQDVYDEIMAAVESGNGGIFFLYGHGGTGKTFIWRSLSSALRSQREVVITVASSGIAALLIPGGRTAHSRFAVPMEIHDGSTCRIKPGTELAELISEAKLIIWKEAPMMNKLCFEALDRTLRDILWTSNPNSLHLPFGGKVVVFGGDFRQILLVIPRGSREDIVSSSINSSYLWDFCKVLKLTRNMRIQHGKTQLEIEEARQFAEWILSVGDGKEGGSNDGIADIQVPFDMLITETSDPVATIVEAIYPSILHIQNPAEYYEQRAILSPTHDVVKAVNRYILSLLPGEETTYFSSDSICRSEEICGDDDQVYSTEFLNGIQCSGVPNHVLILKTGVPVMLLRNIDQSSGLCNGTRLIVTRLGVHIIEAQIISGSKVDDRVYIPHMTLSPSDTKYPFKWQRKQFPLIVCFAMTINKSQGQSLSRVGLYLSKPVFCHGQLYVALSRVTSKKGLKVLICDEKGQPKNTTINVVYQEVFQNLT